MATQEPILEQDTTEESAGRMGPRENVRALPKALKKKLIFPIKGEVDLPPAVREAMEYRVEVVPMVLDDGSILARPELKPGEKPIAYTVLRRGNDLDDLNPQFSPTIDRERFDASKDPQALEKALEKAQALASQKLDMDDVIPGYRKATSENQEKLLRSVFRNTLDGWRETEQNAPEQSQEAIPKKSKQEPAVKAEPGVQPKVPEVQAPEPGSADPVKDWPQTTPPPSPFSEKKAPEPNPDRPTFVRQKPVPILAHKNRPLVLDYGDHITVTRRAMFGIGRRAQEKREQAVGYALQAAVQRFGEPIHFEGNPAFLQETAEMAVKMGIQLEPGSKLAEQIYREAQEKERVARGNTLGPARRQPERQQAVHQDRGLER